MNNNENKPKNDMMEIVHKSLNDTYDLALTHAIRIVRDELLEVDKNSDADSILKIIIIKLNNLKNKQQ